MPLIYIFDVFIEGTKLGCESWTDSLFISINICQFISHSGFRSGQWVDRKYIWKNIDIKCKNVLVLTLLSILTQQSNYLNFCGIFICTSGELSTNNSHIQTLVPNQTSIYSCIHMGKNSILQKTTSHDNKIFSNPHFFPLTNINAKLRHSFPTNTFDPFTSTL